ncbi:hypothetical protein CTRI78_v011553 [Colletotrichum trifolii]|uniref:Uncharacterized protein n=1 Tax=Colletotrichum trifolii TaxID=5466 RepID=A0A4R8QHX5_COLTR|nr:hypothetical protein CTRI78_v011553 [Colletotrichum trifolii]
MPRQPYLYDDAGQNRTGRFPEPKFDPKAITRASWEPKDLKPQLTGPFVTFSRHPDVQFPSKPKTLFYTAGNATPSDTNRDPPVVSGNGNPENMLVSVGGQRWPRLRDSRIQPEADFCYSKPYGELRPATPPVLIGTNRHVSSGNDIENHQHSQAFERRNVSGQVVEEGLAGPKGRFSR